MKAVIYRPAKTAMQSGHGNSRKWVLEFDQESARRIEPLMGWTSSGDMRQQLRLSFDERIAAIDFCRKHDIPFEIRADHVRRPATKSYAENFSFYSVRGPGTAPIGRD